MTTKKIYIAGHRGMVGSTLSRRLVGNAENELLTRGHGDLDLTDQDAVRAFFEESPVDEVYFAAVND